MERRCRASAWRFSPEEVAADHAALLLVAGVAGAIKGEVAHRGELGFHAVEPGVPVATCPRSSVSRRDRKDGISQALVERRS